jgi:hypothetical protein
MNDAPQPESTPPTDRIWDYKPWWCQPWSILLTGNGLIAASWVLGQRYWLTGLVAVPLVAWMGFFVGVFPRMARESGMLDAMKQAKMAPPASQKPRVSDRDPQA